MPPQRWCNGSRRPGLPTADTQVSHLLWQKLSLCQVQDGEPAEVRHCGGTNSVPAHRQLAGRILFCLRKTIPWIGLAYRCFMEVGPNSDPSSGETFVDAGIAR